MPGYQQGSGHWPGRPSSIPHSYPHHPNHSNNPLSPKNFYHTNNTSMAVHYASSQASFSLNATQIPGLGTSGSPPIPEGRSQEYGPRLPPNDAAYRHHRNPTMQQPPRARPSANPNIAQDHDAMEEGELTDDFDDLYEPQEAVPSTTQRQAAPTQADKVPSSRGRSSSDGQDDIFYGTATAGMDTSANRDSPTERERSGSYSPYLSPREIDLEVTTSRDLSDTEAAGCKGKVDAMPSASKVAEPTRSAKQQQGSTTGQIPVPQIILSEPQFKSVDEAKKEAQKAILRLLPLGVKFQTYIDEGFDESVVRSLFSDLNLIQPPSSNRSSDQHSAQDAAKAPAKISTTMTSATGSKPSPGAVGVQTATAAAAEPPKVEERKDRIARLLAAQAARKEAAAAAAPKPTPSMPSVTSAPLGPTIKPSPPVQTAPASVATGSSRAPPTAPAALRGIPTGPSASAVRPPPAAPAALRKPPAGPSADKSKAKTNMELLLKQKLEALQKARGQNGKQVQKPPASETASIKLTSTSVKPESGRPSLQKPDGRVGTETPAGAESTSTPESTESGTSNTQRRGMQSPATAGAAIQRPSSIPGLHFSSAFEPQVSSQSSRKRPVATDFVDYASTVGPPKRPYGQARQDSFIIDISDESDDDVEMEVDSPVGDMPSSALPVDISGRRAPSIRDFPPLSELPRDRQQLSRADSSGTPGKLDQLHGEISSLHKKIAALEARKKKGNSGSQTPDTTNGTPSELTKDVSGSSTEQATEQPSGNVHAPAKEPSTIHGSANRPVSTASEGGNAVPAQATSTSASLGLPKRPDVSKPNYGQLSIDSRPRPAPSRPSELPQRPGGPKSPDLARIERRNRIASFHLPKLEASLLEKQTKLRLLERKVAQLQLEIKQQSEEKSSLTEEMHQLALESVGNATSDAKPPVNRASPSDVVETQHVGDSAAEPVTAAQAQEKRDQEQQQDSSIHPSNAAIQLQTLQPDEAIRTAKAQDSTGVGSPEPRRPESGEVLDDGEIMTDLPKPTKSTPMSVTESQPSPRVNGLAVTRATTAVQGSSAQAAEQPSPGVTSIREHAALEAETSKVSPPVEDDDVEMASEPSSPESGEIDESESDADDERDSDRAAVQADEPSTEHAPDRTDTVTDAPDDDTGTPVLELISDGVHPNDDTEDQDAGSGEVHAFPVPAPDPVSVSAPSAPTAGPALSEKPPSRLGSRYDSPLKYFRSYRYHPQYAQNVAGGLRSLTFTNKINPKLAVCPNELTGERRCRDPQCPFQHFASMVPKDEQVLMDLGRADDFDEGPQKTSFISGLRDILVEFRSQKIRNFDQIGYGIIQYRRKFIGDDSRVLTHLNGTEI